MTDPWAGRRLLMRDLYSLGLLLPVAGSVYVFCGSVADCPETDADAGGEDSDCGSSPGDALARTRLAATSDHPPGLHPKSMTRIPGLSSFRRLSISLSLKADLERSSWIFARRTYGSDSCRRSHDVDDRVLPLIACASCLESDASLLPGEVVDDEKRRPCESAESGRTALH